MTPTLIKFIIELSVLIALWSIARKTQEIDFLKEDMEDTKKKVDLLRGEIFQAEPSFKQKVKKEQIRLDEYPMLDIQLTPRPKVKKPIKKGK